MPAEVDLYAYRALATHAQTRRNAPKFGPSLHSDAIFGPVFHGKIPSSALFLWMVTTWSTPPWICCGHSPSLQQPVLKKLVSSSTGSSQISTLPQSSSSNILASRHRHPLQGRPAVKLHELGCACVGPQILVMQGPEPLSMPTCKNCRQLCMRSSSSALRRGVFGAKQHGIKGPPLFTWKCCSSPSQVSCRSGGACKQVGNILQLDNKKVSFGNLDHSIRQHWACPCVMKP